MIVIIILQYIEIWQNIIYMYTCYEERLIDQTSGPTGRPVLIIIELIHQSTVKFQNKKKVKKKKKHKPVYTGNLNVICNFRCDSWFIMLLYNYTLITS